MSTEPPRPDLAFTPPGAAPTPIESPPFAPPTLLSSPRFVLGCLLLLSGLAILGWYWFGYQTTVSLPDSVQGSIVVQDLGRISQRLAGMIGGGVLTILGAVLVLHGPLTPVTSRPHPPAENPFDAPVGPTS
jgi:hypothetical protein